MFFLKSGNAFVDRSLLPGCFAPVQHNVILSGVSVWGILYFLYTVTFIQTKLLLKMDHYIIVIIINNKIHNFLHNKRATQICSE